MFPIFFCWTGIIWTTISRRTWLEFRTCPLCRCATRCARSTFGRTRSTCYLRITIRNRLVTCESQLETNKSVCGRRRSACYLSITIRNKQICMWPYEISLLPINHNLKQRNLHIAVQDQLVTWKSQTPYRDNFPFSMTSLVISINIILLVVGLTRYCSGASQR